MPRYPEPDPIAQLRKRLIREARLKEVTPDKRIAFLAWWYQQPEAVRDRSDVEPIGPDDGAWLNEALAVLDCFDG